MSCYSPKTRVLGHLSFYMCVKSAEKGNDDCPEGGRLGIGGLLAFVIFCVHVFGIVLFSFRRL